MYYITNQTNHIIAADNALLELLHVESVDELTKQIILEDIHFNSLDETHIELRTPKDKFTYTIEVSSLSSLLGNLQLISLKSILEDTQENNVSEIHNDTLNIPSHFLNDEEESIDEKEIALSQTVDSDDLISIKDSLDSEDEPLLSSDDITELPLVDNTYEKTETFHEKHEEKEVLSDELFDLTLPHTPEETIEEIPLKDEIPHAEAFLSDETTTSKDDGLTTPIVIEVDKISQNIGISPEDYTTFLNEYIDTAISLESDLKSDTKALRTSAVETLTHLADVLELPVLNNIIENLNNLEPEESTHVIETYYTTLSRLITQNNTHTHTHSIEEDHVEPETHSIEEEKVIFDLHESKETPTLDTTEKGFGTINLDDIQPIHFDFRLEEAANDLSLPVELIEEFVHDFIEQANEETKKMIIAYEKGDLDTIQKIGHLLKGASSNLRINPLSDTLYNIQICEDSSQLDALIKQYWGQFIAFEQQIDILSK